MPAGRPTDLSEELSLQIRGYVLDGMNYKTIQQTLDISPNTWDTWYYRNQKDFRVKLNDWKKERLIRKSEKLSEEILDLPHLTEEGKTDTDILRVKQKESEFIRNTLGKMEYSTRTETDITSAGKPIPIYGGKSTDISGYDGNEEGLPAEEAN